MLIKHRLALGLAMLAASATAAVACMDPFTETAKGVKPALDEICARTPAQLAASTVIGQLSVKHGFDEDRGAFIRTGDDGRIVVRPEAAGCSFEISGHTAMIEKADQALRAWSHNNRLTASVSDDVSRSNGQETTVRKRARTGKGELNWTRRQSGVMSSISVVWRRG